MQQRSTFLFKKRYDSTMNYLAHLHLAFRAKSSLLGNMMADYVKGTPSNDYSQAVIDGIRMHRRIYGELRKNFKSSMNIYGPKRG